VDELSSLFGLDCFGDHFIAEKAPEAFKLGKARSLWNDVDQAHRLSALRACLFICTYGHGGFPKVQAGALPNSQPPTPSTKATASDVEAMRLS
jgi:hypothetical protein